MEQSPVLIIDDEYYIRDCLNRLLARQGITSDSAASGEQALELYAENRYPVVICDMCLGDSNGITLLPRFTDLNPDVKVVLLTAYYAPELKRLAQKHGAVRFLAKPFDEKELGGLVKTLLADRGTGGARNANDS